MSIYDTLNKEQKEAVFCTEGPLLLLAGAGSGKTRVLVHRIAYLIEEMGVNPWNIMAITFTNKAAKEMRERVDNMIGYGAESIWVSTFHSTCVRILRRHIDLLGYQTNFTIYDTEDQKKVMKEICKRMKIDTKQLNEKSILNAISHAKEQYLTPDEYKREHEDSFRESKIADVYAAYQAQLKSSNALDFDDLLMKTVELFEHFPNVLELWQERFRYIMIDEYQDTNGVQFLLVKMLSARYRNLCVVGDDDQSIYKFRGADIRNILDFEKVYPDAKVIKLEQNYRSTKNILDAANGVIHHNFGRKDKTLWTGNEEGSKVFFQQYADNYQEALAVALKIEHLVAEEGASYKDIAILNRTNAQSRSFEEKLLLKNIPYKIIGGINFYSRMEVKDILSYLKVICNAVDDQAVKRIINVPRRGIGQTTIDRVQEYALLRGISFMDALYMVRDITTVKAAAAKKIEEFTQLIDQFRKSAEELPLDELFDEILAETGYIIELQAEDTQEAKDRIANIDELKSKVVTYLTETEDATLTGLLEQIALVADIDSVVGDDAVLIMTLHSAKGLEFPYVFIGGMEEGVFPGYRCENAEDESELEEERRLCYVGITRACQKLYLSAARCRMMRGQSQYNRISRFISEIPKEVVDDGGAMAAANKEFSGFGATSSNSSIFGQETKKFVMKPSYQLHSSSKSAESVSQETFVKRSDQGKKEFATKAQALDYEVGDKVRHIKFGIGTVTELIPAGADYEVAVDFEKCGIKRMFASFAKLKKQD